MEKILIIDDSKANRLVLSNVLSEKYSVETAENGEDGINMAKSFIPDLILLDIVMPGIDGYLVCKELKNDDELKKIPVIFLTSKDDTDDIIKAYEIGGADYVLKPYNFLELELRIKTQVNLKKTYEKLNVCNEKKAELVSKMEEMIDNNSAEVAKLNSPEEKISSLTQFKEDMLSQIKSFINE